MKLFNIIIVLLISLSLVACTEPTQEVKQDKKNVKTKKVFKIGIVPQFSPRRIFSIWSPILDELEKKTGYIFQIVGTPTIPYFEKEYQKGTYDIAYMNPYHAIIANQTQGYEAILRDGTKSLFGILVVRREDLINGVKELNGEKISFPAPNALGASLLMRTELKTMHDIDIEPVYVNTHTNSYMSVLEGKTRAGGGVMRTFNELNENTKNQLRVFYTTQKTPPHPIVIHKRVEEEVRQKIKTALLEMSKDEKMKVYLEKIPINKMISTNQEEYQMLKSLGMDRFYVPPSYEK